MSEVTYDFSGERFVVTGASSGMGHQITVELAEAGATVLAIARRTERLTELENQYPGMIVPGVLDVCNSEKLSEAITSFVAEHGKFHGAVHAAGIRASTPLRAYDEETARTVMDVSFWSGVRLMQIINKKKNSMPGCSSILFSSVAAHIGEKSFFAYSAAKSALKVAVRTFAKEVATGFECGLSLENWQDIQVGDTMEVFEYIEVARKLGDELHDDRAENERKAKEAAERALAEAEAEKAAEAEALAAEKAAGKAKKAAKAKDRGTMFPGDAE